MMQAWCDRDPAGKLGASWDMLHFGVGQGHGGRWSPIAEEDGCREQQRVAGVEAG